VQGGDAGVAVRNGAASYVSYELLCEKVSITDHAEELRASRKRAGETKRRGACVFVSETE